MPTFLLSLFASPARIGLLLLSVALAGTGLLAYTRGKEIDVLHAEKAALQASVEGFGDKVREQNRAVEALKAASDAQAVAAVKAARNAAAALGKAQAQIESLRQAAVPQDCSGAMEWLRGTVSWGAQ